MLPREVIEEPLSGYAPTGLHVLVTLADGINRLLIVLALPFEIVSERVVEGIGSALSAPTRVLFELRESLRLQRYGVHSPELRDLAIGCQGRVQATLNDC